MHSGRAQKILLLLLLLLLLRINYACQKGSSVGTAVCNAATLLRHCCSNTAAAAAAAVAAATINFCDANSAAASIVAFVSDPAIGTP
eukprot:15468801-Alexandrium_andersonii.AAC.1